MNVLEQIKAPVAADLDRLRETLRQVLQTENPLLAKAVDHTLQASGKQIRPMLVMLAARMVGEVNESVVNVALALEMLHTSSLVHDDIIDESDRRRGLPSLNAVFGNKTAVLVGDYILCKGMELACKTDDMRVIKYIMQLGQALTEGELLQLDCLESEELSEARYFEVISNKTASLFSVCARLGALAAGGTEEEAERLARYGKLIGMCFQVRDDVFDYGQNDVGKPTGNDMKEGKLTLPVIYAITHSGNEEMRQLAMKVRRLEASDEEIAQLVRFTIDEGALDYAAWRMKDMQGMADGLIDDSRNKEVADALHLLAAFVAERGM